MTTTIDMQFYEHGRHYWLDVIDDDKVRLWLRCQRRWYVVAEGRLSRRGVPLGTIPWELRGVVMELIAEHFGKVDVPRREAEMTRAMTASISATNSRPSPSRSLSYRSRAASISTRAAGERSSFNVDEAQRIPLLQEFLARRPPRAPRAR